MICDKSALNPDNFQHCGHVPSKKDLIFVSNSYAFSKHAAMLQLKLNYKFTLLNLYSMLVLVKQQSGSWVSTEQVFSSESFY